MYSAMFWIEWMDRLHRVLTGARQDVRALNPRSVAGIQRTVRQLTALRNELRLLDRNVLASSVTADNLQKALDTAVFRLGDLSEILARGGSPVSEGILSASDSALRDSLYEAAVLLEPDRRRA